MLHSFLLSYLPAVFFFSVCLVFAKTGSVVQLPNNPTVYAVKRDTAGNVYFVGDLIPTGFRSPTASGLDIVQIGVTIDGNPLRLRLAVPRRQET